MDMPVDEVYEKVMSSGIYEKGFIEGFKYGFKQGLQRGKFGMALRIMESYGIDEAVRISRFSREDLERGELIKYTFNEMIFFIFYFSIIFGFSIFI